MNFLVVGLGSMGKRRVRCLLANGISASNIKGFDTKSERCTEAQEKYKIEIIQNESEIDFKKFTAVIISTPPDKHMTYALPAVRSGISVFIEASVVDEGIEELCHLAEAKQVVVFPSLTMSYFQGPQTIKKLVKDNIIGKVFAWQYQSGQYLPDWHPWEKIEDFYVSNPLTGGCREIVPFELVWLIDLFGPVSELSGKKTKHSEINADIDDIYMVQLEHKKGIYGQLIVDVVSRTPVRSMRITGSEGTIEWDDGQKIIRVFTKKNNSWESIQLNKGSVEQQYINPEEPYIHEIKDFLSCVENKSKPLYTIQDDYQILQLLKKVEISASTGTNQLI